MKKIFHGLVLVLLSPFIFIGWFNRWYDESMQKIQEDYRKTELERRRVIQNMRDL